MKSVFVLLVVSVAVAVAFPAGVQESAPAVEAASLLAIEPVQEDVELGSDLETAEQHHHGHHHHHGGYGGDYGGYGGYGGGGYGNYGGYGGYPYGGKTF